MKLRFYNAKIMPMTDGSIIDGELHTDGGKISYIGSPVQGGGFDREIDLSGCLILPGFKNAHTHGAMTFLRSFADDLPLDKWLHEQVFPHEAKLTEEAVYVFTQLANMEYLTSGITASFDMYFKLDSYAKANTDMGFRTVLCGSINDFGGTVEGIEEEYNKFNALHPLISYQLGFHAEYTTSEYGIYPVLHFLWADGTVDALEDLSTPGGGHGDRQGDLYVIEHTWPFDAVQDLSRLEAVIFEGMAYPLDGSEPYEIDVGDILN